MCTCTVFLLNSSYTWNLHERDPYPHYLQCRNDYAKFAKSILGQKLTVYYHRNYKTVSIPGQCCSGTPVRAVLLALYISWQTPYTLFVEPSELLTHDAQSGKIIRYYQITSLPLHAESHYL